MHQKKFRLMVQIMIHSDYDRLEVREEIEIDEMGFLEIAKLLGRFHELAQQIKKERDGGPHERV